MRESKLKSEDVVTKDQKTRSENRPVGPSTKVLPPGKWQKLLQPKASDAKEMYETAKKRVKRITDKMEKICIAPGEYEKFKIGETTLL